MTDRVLSFLFRIAFAALDFWAKAQIEKTGWSVSVKEHARQLEERLIKLLEPVLGDIAKRLAGSLVKRSLARIFPNDPTTADWG